MDFMPYVPSNAMSLSSTTHRPGVSVPSTTDISPSSVSPSFHQSLDPETLSSVLLDMDDESIILGSTQENIFKMIYELVNTDKMI